MERERKEYSRVQVVRKKLRPLSIFWDLSQHRNSLLGSVYGVSAVVKESQVVGQEREEWEG